MHSAESRPGIPPPESANPAESSGTTVSEVSADKAEQKKQEIDNNMV